MDEETQHVRSRRRKPGAAPRRVRPAASEFLASLPPELEKTPMSALPIVPRLLLAARQAYDIAQAGPAPDNPAYEAIGWANKPVAFVGGLDGITAALVGATANETIVSFRGTLPPLSNSPDKRQVFLDWLNDFDALLVPGQNLPGLVHQGFLNALDPLWLSVLNQIPAGKPIYFTGHSKGGALANLAAARWATLNPAAPAPAVITFAAAKPGNGDFQAAYDRLVPHSLRYEYQDDIVPHLPPGAAFRDVFAGVPAIAGALAQLPSVRTQGSAGYVSVGDLMFINWDDAIAPYSLLLRLERYQHLADLFLTFNFGRIIADHTLADGGGYAKALLPAAAPVAVAAAAVISTP
jgi:hypothetical protein